MAAVTLPGLRGEVITLEVDRARLAVIGTLLEPITAALRGQNVRLPSGSIVTRDMRAPLETTDQSAPEDERQDDLDARALRHGAPF